MFWLRNRDDKNDTDSQTLTDEILGSMLRRGTWAVAATGPAFAHWRLRYDVGDAAVDVEDVADRIPQPRESRR